MLKDYLKDKLNLLIGIYLIIKFTNQFNKFNEPNPK